VLFTHGRARGVLTVILTAACSLSTRQLTQVGVVYVCHTENQNPNTRSAMQPAAGAAKAKKGTAQAAAARLTAGLHLPPLLQAFVTTVARQKQVGKSHPANLNLCVCVVPRLQCRTISVFNEQEPFGTAGLHKQSIGHPVITQLP
jgi:hypothetical protein